MSLEKGLLETYVQVCFYKLLLKNTTDELLDEFPCEYCIGYEEYHLCQPSKFIACEEGPTYVICEKTKEIKDDKNN